MYARPYLLKLRNQGLTPAELYVRTTRWPLAAWQDQHVSLPQTEIGRNDSVAFSRTGWSII